MFPNTDSCEWKGRRALITGGTSGSGFQAAKRLVTFGADVMIVGRNRERAERAVMELGGLSGSVSMCIADCGDYDQAAGAVDRAVTELGGLDIVVSAGARGEGDPKPFSEMAPIELRNGLLSRFLARVQPVHASIPYLRARSGASIVLLTTDAGRHATSGETIVGAYAAGIIQFTKSLARELSRDRIRVNSVSMTLTADTQTWHLIFRDDSFQKALFEKALERFPFGSAPTAADVADAVVFLASARASHVTGQTISVNGGLSFGGW